MRSTSTTSTLLALALLTTTAFASQDWEPEHKYDYRLPGREYRTAALHLSDSIQLHLPATLNNRLPYTPEDFFHQSQQSQLAGAASPLLLPYSLFGTSHGFLGALLCVAVVLGAVLAASRVVRVVKRRRFFARRWGFGEVFKKLQDYTRSEGFETPKRKLRVSMLGLGGAAGDEGEDVNEGERARDWMGGKDSPV